MEAKTGIVDDVAGIDEAKEEPRSRHVPQTERFAIGPASQGVLLAHLDW